ncbi:MAG: methyltransferase type 11 [Pseudanabaena sp.]|nr:MAG: methyltransferase type 11 [Pseudanabaena sp.]
MRYLNLGCGSRYDTEWENIDFTAHSKFVISHNLEDGIPSEDNMFDVVYHSHVLEHFSRDKAQFFIEECYRVLRTGGIIRVVVPDLEDITRNYLWALEKVGTDGSNAKSNHEWMTIELLDQMVRRSQGGEMIRYVLSKEINNREFIAERMGSEITNIMKSLIKNEFHNSLKTDKNTYNFIDKAYLFIKNSKYRKETILKLILGKEYPKLQVGRFCESGEMHQWMYDKISLSNLLSKVGFAEIASRNACDSYVPNWQKFNLDTELDGSVYKPQSLYMEAIKP